MNIHGLKLKRKRARQMISEELRKRKPDHKKVEGIRSGIKILNNRIKHMKDQRDKKKGSARRRKKK